MVAGARDASQAQGCVDVLRVLAELSPVDQGVVLATLCGELARLQPRPAEVLAMMLEVARARAGVA